MYTPEHYEQDKRIALFIFNKNFKGHYLKDDLIQVATIELWKLRQSGNYKDYVRCACGAAFNTMIDYLRKETRHFADSLFGKVGSTDLELIDVLINEQPTAQDYCEAKEIIRNIMPLPILVSKRNRKIIAMHLKHYTQAEISESVGVSRQCVNRIIKAFREAARQVLEIRGGE